jgi:hypothetical protein
MAKTEPVRGTGAPRAARCGPACPAPNLTSPCTGSRALAVRATWGRMSVRTRGIWPLPYRPVAGRVEVR